jgi:hypothetical protein
MNQYLIATIVQYAAAIVAVFTGVYMIINRVRLMNNFNNVNRKISGLNVNPPPGLMSFYGTLLIIIGIALPIYRFFNPL